MSAAEELGRFTAHFPLLAAKCGQKLLSSCLSSFPQLSLFIRNRGKSKRAVQLNAFDCYIRNVIIWCFICYFRCVVNFQWHLCVSIVTTQRTILFLSWKCYCYFVRFSLVPVIVIDISVTTCLRYPRWRLVFCSVITDISHPSWKYFYLVSRFYLPYAASTFQSVVLAYRHLSILIFMFFKYSKRTNLAWLVILCYRDNTQWRRYREVRAVQSINQSFIFCNKN